MASKQHHPLPGGQGEPAAKRQKVEESPSTHSVSDHHRVELNPADCGLDFDIEANGLQGSALHKQGFAYCWSGARANVGIKRGKYCFGCKVVSEQVVNLADTPVDQQHLSRVGISRGDDSVGNLGETIHSFGFGGTGKFSNAGKFSGYGEKFGVGDVIVCAIDLEKKPLATVGFSKNGKWLGIAREFDASLNGFGIVGAQVKKLPWESALFPHVLLKNVVVQLLFSISDGLTPMDAYKPWNSAIEDGNAIFGPTFSRKEECEVLMMVGLPASGKTTWAEKRVKDHPEKRYVLLGTNLALDLMKVPGLLRKRNYGERFELLMDRATGIFNTLLARAAKTPRNYILDQTNVYKTARKRKLKPFMKFRKIAVVIFPMPTELKDRAAKRFEEMGKEVPADAVNEMIAHYALPTSMNMSGSTEQFDEVIFPELGREEAQRHLDEMKRALPPSSNTNIKHELSPFSRERHAQSFPRPLVANKEPITDFEQHNQTPQSNVLFSDYSSPSQAIPAYGRPTFSSEHPPRTDDTNLAMLSKPAFETTQCRNYEGTGTLYVRDGFDRFGRYDRTPAPFQRSETDYYGNYDRTSSFQRGAFDFHNAYSDSNLHDTGSFGRSSSSFGGMSPYQTPRSTDTFLRPKFEDSSPISRPYGYSPTPPSYGSHGGQFHDPGAPHFNHHPAMTDQYDRMPPQTLYGSPYAPTPPPRPSPLSRDVRPRIDYPPYARNH
ncbi:heterogeneous nuclear ribonucleoprotein U-like protein 1 isoform X1 [Dendrobium catenatum]|uniref:heterogeneous nuclear ribonucleoprotein U-like protein 1 isoform X1 n=1 Tax=Dendrobium catenatum TaxID=906689 RepID=UPI00109FF3AB|nr:heterogeneous nuclear ribonucleoprotein U-like protein 1 isoform X1 [Dendrobium catenatum]